jgi:hypothetical protein
MFVIDNVLYKFCLNTLFCILLSFILCFVFCIAICTLSQFFLRLVLQLIDAFVYGISTYIYDRFIVLTEFGTNKNVYWEFTYSGTTDTAKNKYHIMLYIVHPSLLSVIALNIHTHPDLHLISLVIMYIEYFHGVSARSCLACKAGLLPRARTLHVGGALRGNSCQVQEARVWGQFGLGWTSPM